MEELSLSKKILEDYLGEEVTSFAYPYVIPLREKKDIGLNTSSLLIRVNYKSALTKPRLNIMSFSSGFKRYAQNTGYLLFGKAADLFFLFIINLLMIRYLGPAQFGIFSYASSFVFLFKDLAGLGLDSLIVKNLLEMKDKDRILGSSFVLKLLGGGVSFLIILITINIMPMALTTKTLIMIISLGAIFQSFNVIEFYFQARVLAKYAVYSQLFSLVAMTVLCIFFIHFKFSLVYFAYIIFCEPLIISIGLLVFYKLEKNNIRCWSADLRNLRHLLSNCWPLVINGIAVSVYMRSDQIIIKNLLNESAVGFYSAAVKVSELFYIIPVVLTISLFPAIINAKTRSYGLYYERLKMLFSFLFWVAVAIAIIITLISKPLVNILFGPQYNSCASVLSLHIWAGIFVFWGTLVSKYMVNENLQVYFMIYTILGAMVNIFLNCNLIPFYGIKGGAIAAILTQFIVAVLGNLFIQKTRKIFLLEIESLNFFQTFKKYHGNRTKF